MNVVSTEGQSGEKTISGVGSVTEGGDMLVKDSST